MKEEDYKRLIVVGDIHGQYDMLVDLMDKIKPTKDDFFVFIGDYIDRGHNSKKVIEFLINFEDQFPSVFIKGNHEDMLMAYLGLDEEAIYGDSYPFNGGEFTALSYGGNAVDELKDLMPDEHIGFIKKTSVNFETKNFFFCHGGIIPGIPFEDQTRETMLWIRYQFFEYPTGLDKVVVFGHTPQQKVRIEEDKIGIDTGAGYFKKLSAIDCFSKQIYQVKY
ncbi:MAG TPA: serine/threonine protein phosphatase [Candidatus Cloacimonetes bacterium]|nr:serine/threonine protein phosphatase [Candidatus Cloacimonadota bacterium]